MDKTTIRNLMRVSEVIGSGCHSNTQYDLMNVEFEPLIKIRDKRTFVCIFMLLAPPLCYYFNARDYLFKLNLYNKKHRNLGLHSMFMEKCENKAAESDVGMSRRTDGLLPHHVTTVSSDKKHTSLWAMMLTLEVVIYGSYSILVNLSKTDGQLPYKSGSVVILIEFTKLMISVVMFSPEFIKRNYRLPHIRWSMLASFAIPAVLYTFNNNMALYMQLQMDPTTFQVLNNLKIGTTALLYKLIIKREITKAQWVALGLLTTAGICDSYGGYRDRNVEGRPFQIFITITGLMMMLTYCSVSGFAAVYSEYLLKGHISTSLHLQNILLYMYGVIMNAGTVLWQSHSYDQEQDGFFKGFSLFTWLVIFTQAFNGLIMSVVMKHGSNLTRLFIISGGMITSTLLSIFLFGTQMNIYFLVAASLVVMAIYLYHH